MTLLESFGTEITFSKSPHEAGGIAYSQVRRNGKTENEQGMSTPRLEKARDVRIKKQIQSIDGGSRLLLVGILEIRATRANFAWLDPS